MAEALLVFETLDTDDIDKLVAGEEISRAKPLETKLIAPERVDLDSPEAKEKDDTLPKPEPEPGMA